MLRAQTPDIPVVPRIPRQRLSSANRSRIAKAAIGGQPGEEEGVGYPDGKPHYQQPFEGHLTDTQVATNNRGVTAGKKALAESRAERNKHNV